jgi:hypothetical protein
VVQFVFGKTEKGNHKQSPKQEGKDFGLLFKELWNGWKVENEGNGKNDKIVIKGVRMDYSLPCVFHYVFINEKLLKVCPKMSTFGVHRLDWLVVSKRFPWNAKYETVYRWLASFIVIYTIMELKS